MLHFLQTHEQKKSQTNYLSYFGYSLSLDQCHNLAHCTYLCFASPIPISPLFRCPSIYQSTIYVTIMCIKDFAFYVGTRVKAGTNKLTQILRLQLIYGIVSYSISPTLLYISPCPLIRGVNGFYIFCRDVSKSSDK